MRYPALAVFALLLFSCASGPKTISSGRSADVFGVFPKDALFYCSFDKEKGKEIYEEFFPSEELQDQTTKDLVEATTHIAFALYRHGGETSMLAVLSGGSYPVLKSALYFLLSSDWEITNEGGSTYWKSKKMRLAIAVQSRAVFLAAGPEFFVKNGVSLPEGFESLTDRMVAGGWLPAGSFLNKIAEENNLPVRLPIEDISFAVRADGSNFVVSLRLRCGSASQAKMAAAMFSLLSAARGSLSGSLRTAFGALLTNAPRTDGSSVIITSTPLSGAAVAGLIHLFSLN